LIYQLVLGKIRLYCTIRVMRFLPNAESKDFEI
jgi:hypothetical protein